MAARFDTQMERSSFAVMQQPVSLFSFGREHCRVGDDKIDRWLIQRQAEATKAAAEAAIEIEKAQVEPRWRLNPDGDRSHLRDVSHPG